VVRYDPTIENTFQKSIPFRRVRFLTEIVDSAGIDEHSRLSRSASLGVHGYLLVYSVNSRLSFDKIQAIDDLVVECHGGSASVARVLVATMIDSHDRQVSFEEGQAIADARGIPFIETTARGNVNVSEAFITLLREIEGENGMFEHDEYGSSFIDDPMDNPLAQCIPSLASWCTPASSSQQRHPASLSPRDEQEPGCFPPSSLPRQARGTSTTTLQAPDISSVEGAAASESQPRESANGSETLSEGTQEEGFGANRRRKISVAGHVELEEAPEIARPTGVGCLVS